DWAVREWPETRRDDRAINLFAQDLDLDAAMIAGCEGRAAHRCSYYYGRVGAEAVGLGKRPLNDSPEELASVTAMLGGAAFDSDKRLRGNLAHIVARQQDGHRVVFAGRGVEHGAPDSAFVFLGLLPLAAAEADFFLKAVYEGSGC